MVFAVAFVRHRQGRDRESAAAWAALEVGELRRVDLSRLDDESRAMLEDMLGTGEERNRKPIDMPVLGPGMPRRPG